MIAVLNVKKVLDKVLEESLDRRLLQILHDPIKNDISHSEIKKLKPDNELIAEIIIEAILDTYNAKN